MLANAKQPADEFADPSEDNLLMDNEERSTDIMVLGERIAEKLGKVKTINPNLLASQLG